MEKLQKCCERYEGFFKTRFEKLGSFISKYPKSVMSTCVVVNSLFLIGLLNFSTENDVEMMYTPSNSQAYNDRELLRNVYSDPTTSNFESYQLQNFGRYVDIIIISKNNSNIMNQQHIDEINKINQFIQNSIVVNETDGTTYRFADVCALSSSGCSVLGGVVLDSEFQRQLIQRNVSYPMHNSQLLSPIFANAKSHMEKLAFTIGVKLRYYLRQNSSLSKTWENAYLNQITYLKTNFTDIAYANSESLETELNKDTSSDITFFSLTFTLMMTYACLASASPLPKCNNIANRANLGIAGVITPVLGIGAALGFVSGIGIKFTNIVGVMPFLIIAIGIDDMFILMSGMAGAPSLLNASIEDRMKSMLRTSGISITITSVTDLLAFGVGATSVFLSIRNFCIYTGVAVMFCYINQLFFMCPAICLNEIRTSKRRHYCVCCLEIKERNSEQNSKNPIDRCLSGNIPKTRDDVESFFEKYPKELAVKIHSHIVGKIMICILFTSYLVSSIYGIVYLKQGLLLFNLVSKKSYFHTYTTWDNDYFTVEPPIAICIKNENTYSMNSTQSQISSIMTQAKLDAGIDDTFEINWLTAYKQTPFYDDTTETRFVSGLKSFLSIEPRFTNDIVFSNSKLKIISSKFYIKSLNLKSSSDQGALMERLRELSDNSQLYFFYTPAFIFFEQYVQILPSTLLTVGIAVVVILAVTFIFMPRPLLVIIVASTVISIMVGIFGFMYYWDLTLSSVTMIHLVMSVGFSVDFAVHICHSFLSSRSEKEVLKSALDKSGGPVFNAAFSSLLGIVMLFFSESYIFQSFGKVMLLVISFGLVHAVFFLPLLLDVLMLSMKWKQFETRKTNDEETHLNTTEL